MHPEALAAVTKALEEWTDGPANLLDVGSFDVNGNYRGMVTGRGW